MPTTVTSTVDDGSNLASPDYTSLSSFESGEQRDLVAADEIAEAECYGFVDGTSLLTFGGWTTDPTRYINVRVASGHRHGGVFVADGSAYLMRSTGDFPLNVNAGHDLRLDGVQVENQRSDGFGCTAYNANHDGGETTDCRSEDCIFVADQNADSDTLTFRGGATNTSNEFRWKNCVFWATHVSTSSMGLFSDNAGVHYVHNCTAHIPTGSGASGTPELDSNFGTMHCTNTRATGEVSFGTDGMSGDSDYNLSEDASAPGTNSITNATPDYVDAPNGDFHLNSGDPGVDAGTDLSADADYAVTADFEGDSRPQGSGWDIGADEFVSSGTTISAPVAAATAESTAPQIAPSTSVSIPVSPSTAEVQAPSVAPSIGLSTPVASGIADVIAPSVLSVTGLNVSVAPANAESLPPSLQAVVSLNAPGAPTQATALEPSVAPTVGVSVPVSITQMNANAPSVTTTVGVSAPVSLVEANATAPTIVQGTTLSLAVAETIVESTAPSPSPGTSSITTAVAEVLGEVTDPQVDASVSAQAPGANINVESLAPSMHTVITLTSPSGDTEVTVIAPQVSSDISVTGSVATVIVEAPDISVIGIVEFDNLVEFTWFVQRSEESVLRIKREEEFDTLIKQEEEFDWEI